MFKCNQPLQICTTLGDDGICYQPAESKCKYRSSNTDHAEEVIGENLREAANYAHNIFMGLPKHHKDEKYWRELSMDINQIVNDYL